MAKQSITISLLLLVLLTPATLLYANTQNESQFSIEVLVFKDDINNSESNELWNFDTVDDVIESIDQAEILNNTPPKDSLLTQVAEKITAENSEYVILAHQFWTQPAYPSDTRKSIRIKRIHEDSEIEIDGIAQLYIKQYLHLNLDILMRAYLAVEQNGETDPANLALQTYRITEHRKIRRNKLYYFDHPKFGVIAAVQKIN